MTDAKDWVTIRIPEPTRDDASADPRTYEVIMQAGLAMPIEERTIRRFNDAKAETGGDVPAMDADTFLNSLLDTHEKVQEQGYGDGKDETERVLDAIENQLHFAQEMDTAGVDEATLAEYVADYLVAEYDLPRKVAEEVRQ